MKYTTAQKQSLIHRYRAGESATAICLQSGIPCSTFYSWLRPHNPQQVGSAPEAAKLERQVRRLQEIIQVLKIAQCTATASTQEKLAALEKLHGQYSAHVCVRP